jgi:hypothetical protein
MISVVVPFTTRATLTGQPWPLVLYLLAPLYLVAVALEAAVVIVALQISSSGKTSADLRWPTLWRNEEADGSDLGLAAVDEELDAVDEARVV